MPRIACVPLLATLALSVTALAQKPVLTRNADEPGRSPLQQNVLINQTADSCPNDDYCVVNFDPVPAGYRLVITYASARFDQLASDPAAYSALAIDGSPFGMQTILPGGADSSLHRFYLGAGAVTFYVDAGHTPSILFSGFNIRTGDTSQAAISGYLVALP